MKKKKKKKKNKKRVSKHSLQNSFWRFKSKSINTKLKIKVHIDKQLLLVTKLEYKVVNVILQQLITCSNSPKENTRKRSKGCLKLTIKTLCDIIWRCLRIFIFSFEHFVNFEHIENFYLQGLLVFLNKSTCVSYIYQQTKSWLNWTSFFWVEQWCCFSTILLPTRYT